MKKYLPLLILLFSIQVNAGTFPVKDSTESYVPKNSIYLEIGGITGVYSLNYERVVYRFSDKLFCSIRLFGGAVSANPELGLDIWGGVGVRVDYMFSKKHDINFSVNQWVLKYNVYDFFEPNGEKTIIEKPTSLSLGYTYNTARNWFFGASYTPIILYNEPETEYVKFQSWAGISVGKIF